MTNTTSTTTPLHALIAKVYPTAVALRRAIHAHPELSGQEFKTAQLVFNRLQALGLKPRYCLGKTGVTAQIDNGNGKLIALRADMDALPIHENNPVDFCSKTPGVMHACGHDLHTACLLGAAEVLLQTRTLWQGKALLIFQPSEEAEPSGARRLIEEGIFPQNANAVIGLHVNPELPTGTLGLKPGVDYAGILDFDVIVHGKGGHGAKPELARAPIPPCAQMILALETLAGRSCPPLEPVVITVGQMSAGSARNVIPDQARFSGTMRTFSTTVEQRIVKRMKHCLSSIATAYEVRAEINPLKSFPPGYNNTALTELARKALNELIDPTKVIIRDQPIMYSEDFAYYQQLVPGLYAHLGVRNPRKRTIAGLHNASFLPDEAAIQTGIAFHVGTTMALLEI